MKRKIFALGMLSLGAVLHAQSTQALLFVGDQAGVHIKENTLMYKGGEVKTKESGKIDNFGNVMIVGGGLKTLKADNTLKTDGGNFILRLATTATDGAIKIASNIKYGQLYINGTTQNEVTGIVDKEYKDNTHGTYQQIAIPFLNKKFSDFATNVGAENKLTDNRWTRSEILVWNNRMVRFDQMKVSENTSNTTSDNRRSKNAGTTYYAIGTANFSPFPSGVHTVKGVPLVGNISEPLADAGKDIDFGTNGNNRNYYREIYNTYLQDYFDRATPWTGNFGRNIYQFGNPYLTNLDLGQLGIANIQGIRIEPSKVGIGDTSDGAATFITYTSGVPTGDIKQAIIGPMQTFLVKLSSNTPATLNFNDLRRFKYEARAVGVPYGVNAQSKSNDLIELSSLKSNSVTENSEIKVTSKTLSTKGSVKQLGVIALNAEGKEIGRTYYVVYPNGVSGQPEKVSTQVSATSNHIIGTFEEAKTGGVDESLASSYWLYINEANENDFKGKEIPLRLYSNNIKSLKFEILENAEDVAEGQERLSSGEGFHIFDGKKIVSIANNKTIPIYSTDENFGLYYGKPVVETKKETTISKPSATVLAYDESVSAYKLLFDPEWKTATVQVFDMSGRLIFTQSNVDANNEFVVNLPTNIKASYIVTAISDTGKKFSQKVINK